MVWGAGFGEGFEDGKVSSACSVLEDVKLSAVAGVFVFLQKFSSFSSRLGRKQEISITNLSHLSLVFLLLWLSQNFSSARNALGKI